MSAVSNTDASDTDAPASTQTSDADDVAIPGPLRSLLRMAGVSQEVSPDEVLPLLARNVYLRGYQDGSQTEFLILLNRYVQFARELQAIAGESNTIHVESCEDAARLIHVLGYQFQRTCGQADSYLVASNAERAFLTVDSGFPLTRLENALQRHAVFTYLYPSTRVPALFRQKDWITVSYWRQKGGTDLLDVLLHDRSIDRLYWALSKNDQETQAALRHSPGLRALVPLAPALDFYGSQISIHSGRVLVPGGPDAAHEWEELVGASPTSPSAFVSHLLEKDRGWLAAYFDASSRIPRAQQTHLTEGRRLKLLYDAYRRIGADAHATAGVYPKNADLLILFTRLQWQPDGKPYVPGNLGIWREVLGQNSTPELVRNWLKHANRWDDPDQLLLTLVACAGIDSNSGPLQLYLTLNAIDASRSRKDHLSDGTVRLLANTFPQFHSWDLIFSDFPGLDDTSITRFVSTAQAVNGISNPTLRANAMGAFQADIGLWEIFARQQQIPNDRINRSWQEAVQPFAAISSSIQLFDASRNSLRSLLVAVNGTANLSQDQIIDLLAGPPQTTEVGRRVHAQLAERMRSVLDDQRLASLDTLFGLYDGLDQMAHGTAMGDRLVQLAGDLREFEVPRPVFTSSEKIAWTGGIYNSRHAELQIRTDLTKVIRAPGSAAQLEAARGRLTPFLRDTLVGLNYAYYEPPGAQALHHNPLLVRSHDFSGTSIQNYSAVWDSPELIGIGVTAGGGAYMIGSLSDLPYVLALTEEDFITPENVQALIWRAEVPELLVSAIQPRWWRISSTELHAASLYQRCGEELLADAEKNPKLQAEVTEVLSDVMTAKRLESTEETLLNASQTSAAGANALLSQVTPAEKFYLAAEFRKRFPSEAAASGAASRELDDLARKEPSDTDPERLSEDFGVPHPTLAQTDDCGILEMKPLPAYAGNAYRLLGESWQSSNLYWARTADEMGYSPVMLNLLIPELTRDMISKIFATDLEDWPALLRAMEQTGSDFREGRIRTLTAPSTITTASNAK